MKTDGSVVLDPPVEKALGDGSGERLIRCSKNVPERCRPSAHRAAAAALLAPARFVPGATVAKAEPDTRKEGVQQKDRKEADRHLRVVRRRERTPAERRRHIQIVMVLGVVAGLCIALSLVYVHVVLAQRQFRLDRLDSQVQTDQTNYQNLRLQVAQLGSPANIIVEAEGRLGMVQPANVTYLPDNPGALTKSASSPSPVASTTRGRGTVAAPTGDADWPLIKSALAGSP
jgi:cell division protein FtsL